MKNRSRNKKFLIGTTLFLLFLSAISSKAQNADQLLGNWLSEPKDAKINIYKNENGIYSGKLTWGARMYQKDGKTSRIAKNGKPFKDMIILKNWLSDKFCGVTQKRLGFITEGIKKFV